MSHGPQIQGKGSTMCGMPMYWTCFSIDLYGEQSGVKVEIGDDQLTEVSDDGILIRYHLCIYREKLQ